MPRSVQEQIVNKCIYFNGVMNKTCEAGITYSDVAVDKPYKFPCLKQGGVCECAKFPTEQEVRAIMKEMEESTLKTLTAYALVKEHFHKTGERKGIVKCQCGGDLHFAVATINNHIWAKCKSCSIAFNE